MDRHKFAVVIFCFSSFWLPTNTVRLKRADCTNAQRYMCIIYKAQQGQSKNLLPVCVLKKLPNVTVLNLCPFLRNQPLIKCFKFKNLLNLNYVKLIFKKKTSGMNYLQTASHEDTLYNIKITLTSCKLMSRWIFNLVQTFRTCILDQFKCFFRNFFPRA